MSEKICLKWNDFQSNVSKSFGLLRVEQYLHDVTLVADDKKQISAHRLVLSACSNYFKEVFKNNAQFSHPLLCLNGVGSEDLTNILDYIYNGQVSIHPERLDRFLEVAQRFKLEGLLQDNQCAEKPAEETIEMNTQVSVPDQSKLIAVRTDEEMSEPSTKEHDHTRKDVSASSNILELEERINQCLEKSGAGLDVVEIDDNDEEDDDDFDDSDDDDDDDDSDDSDDDDEVELEEKINEYLEVTQDGSFKCTLCGKASENFINLKSHIEIYCYTKLKLNQKIATLDSHKQTKKDKYKEIDLDLD